MATTPYRQIAEDVRAGWTPDVQAVANRTGADLRARLAADERLGQDIAALRRENHLSQAQLAQRASVQQADISRIERGLGNPTRDTLVRLASALGGRLTVVGEPAPGED
ncbi:helix-turn-helix domain-containing protein [Cellulomonas endometrii]|uniref:helix-turn-helix domain-containing protein n=1 Tax=Cellulomonas endometrii TaxID=3036301 RepID=UPI0024ADB129|nr:helix-turn-helix transcriptional regulator [Cellulomonas endometrii]